MRSIGRPGLGTLVLAVVRGLIMDVEATRDVSHAGQAFEDFLAALASAAYHPNRRPSRSERGQSTGAAQPAPATYSRRTLAGTPPTTA
jgi:hypothetical protein